MPPDPLELLPLLEPDTRAAFRALGRPDTWRGGQDIIVEGMPSDFLVLIESGLVEVLKLDADGTQAFRTFRGRGTIVGEYGILDGGTRSATVRAVGTVRGLRFGRLTLREFAGRHPELSRHLHRMSLHKTRAGLERDVRYGSGPQRRRVARVLLDHSEWYGRDVEGYRVIDVPLTYRRIADLVHGGPRRVGHLLTDWEAAGVLVTAQHGIRRLRVLDRERLAADG